MKLRAVGLNNVRRFTTPVRIDGIRDGVNILSAPNESGKSTVLDALTALMFSKHSGRGADIKRLQPHAGGAPSVWARIETDDGVFTLTKQWLSKPMATVHRGDTLLAQADAAEDWIASQMGDGTSGLVWVRQGETDLGDGKKDPSLPARRDLLSSVQGEVETMTGGRRMDRVLAACQAQLAPYTTATGKPTGAWSQAQKAVTLATEQRDALAATARDLHQALQDRREARRALDQLQDAEAAADRAARLAEARTARDAARAHADRVEQARVTASLAESGVTAATKALETHAQGQAELKAAQAQAETTQTQAHDAQQAKTKTADDLAAARTALTAAQDKSHAARAALDAAQRRDQARGGAQRRRDLAGRLDQAEQARKTGEAAAAAAKLGPDDTALRRLEDLSGAVTAARTLRDSAAVQMVMDYAPGQEGSVRVDGAPLPPGSPRAVPARTVVELGPLGRLTVDPGPMAQDDTAVTKAEDQLRDALDAAGLASLAEARTQNAARAKAQSARDNAAATFKALAPKGLDSLRAELAAIPDLAEDPSGDDAGPDVETATQTWHGAEAARGAAEQARDTAQLADTRNAEHLATARAQAASAQDRLSRAHQAAGTSDGAVLQQALTDAQTAFADASAVLQQVTQTVPDLTMAEAALSRAEAIVARTEADIAARRETLATLDERIRRSTGDAVEEQLAEAEQTLSAAQRQEAEIAREVQVLRLLHTTLTEARAEARDRYFAPIAAELRPLLGLLWEGDATLDWSDDTLLPTGLRRGDVTEPLTILSGGTQEQIALMVRLAFARMLARQGRHAPVILDDALVFADDRRIQRMFDGIYGQATDLQILVLTCRDRTFRDLGGHSLTLTPDEA